MTDLDVIGGYGETPIEQLPERERLGQAIIRGRVREKMSCETLAERLGMPLKVLSEIEAGRAVTTAVQLREMAAVLRVDPELLLSSAKAFHRALWAEKDAAIPGVQLESIEGSVATPGATEMDVDGALTAAHDEMVFLANVSSHASRHALSEVHRLRKIMRRRGIDVPDDEDTDGGGRDMRNLSIAEVDDAMSTAWDMYACKGGDPKPMNKALEVLRRMAESRSSGSEEE